MLTIEQISRAFDDLQIHDICSALPPTLESIQVIEKAIGVKLSPVFIAFARSSQKYGNWFSSLGPDFNSQTHMLNLNQMWHNHEDKDSRLPSNLWIINVGYDDDFDCIDVETYDSESLECYIAYWSPGVPLHEGQIYDSFYNYVHAHVLGWYYT